MGFVCVPTVRMSSNSLIRKGGVIEHSILNMNQPEIYKYKSAMIIDDSEVDQYITSRILKASLLVEKILIQSNVPDALKSLNDLISKSQFPELIFLDIQMPQFSGFDFLEGFKKLDKAFTSNCLIFMLTASNDPKEHNRATESPYVKKLLFKPLTIEAFRMLDKVAAS